MIQASRVGQALEHSADNDVSKAIYIACLLMLWKCFPSWQSSSLLTSAPAVLSVTCGKSQEGIREPAIKQMALVPTEAGHNVAWYI